MGIKPRICGRQDHDELDPSPACCRDLIGCLGVEPRAKPGCGALADHLDMVEVKIGAMGEQIGESRRLAREIARMHDGIAR